MDPSWLKNNIKTILFISFGIGGFVPICIGLSFVVLDGNWPSNYIPPKEVTTPIVITIIYLITLICHDIKSYKEEIELRYGSVEKENKED